LLSKILLTGGGGFIGSHLAEELLTQGEEVTIADVDISRNVSHIQCEKILADVRDRQTLAQCLRQKDVVIHLAAVSRVEWGQQHPLDCVQTNVLGTLNVLDAIKSSGLHPLFVLVSSREVYGEPGVQLVTEAHGKNPISIYGSSKLAAESLTRTYGQHFEIPFVIVRLSNTYGSRRDLPGRVIPRFMQAALSASPLIVNGGEQCLDFVYIKDVVRGFTTLVRSFLNGNKAPLGQDLHFVSGKGTKVMELARLIKDICKSESKIDTSDLRPFDVQNFVGDPSKTYKLLGIRFTVSLRDGLLRYLGEVRA